jgi:F-type H+-transporting ATPase subunit epsilon
MIPKALALEIVTPDKPIVRGDVDEVQLPGREGAFGVLPGHTPLLALLNPGELWYRKGTEKATLVIDFGLAEVLPDRVTVLVSLAEPPEAIDVAQEEAAKADAERNIKQAGTLEDAERARIALLTTLMRLRAAERVRGRRG